MPVPDFESNNPCTQRLASLLDLPPPGAGQREVVRVENANVRLQFHLLGPGGRDFYIVAQGGQGERHDGQIERPDVTLTASAADWSAIQAGTLDRAQAFLGGKLKIEGDLTLLMQFEEMISRLGVQR